MTRFISLLSLILFTSNSAFSQAVEVNGIAAKVNGRVITKNEVSFMLAPIYAQLATQYPRRGPEFEKQFKDAQQKILQELIDRQIILDEFNKLGANLNANIVDQEVKRQIRQLYNGNESKFREELKKSRLTMEGYREMTREKMVVQAMRSQQFADAPPPLPNEIQNEYNKIKSDLRDITKDKITFSKIFIPATDEENPIATPESQLALAESLVKEIQNGAVFEEVAKTHSRDAFATTGGFRENIARTDLTPEFAAIIFQIDDGKIAGPLLDPLGFTIVKIISKDLAPPPPLGEVRELIEERVKKNKTSAQYERWIENRRKRAMIDTKI